MPAKKCVILAGTEGVVMNWDSYSQTAQNGKMGILFADGGSISLRRIEMYLLTWNIESTCLA